MEIEWVLGKTAVFDCKLKSAINRTTYLQNKPDSAHH